MMEQTQTSSQSCVSSGQSQAGGPDEVIVNEQEQDKEVNQQDETIDGNEGEKAYSEGNMNNSDTDAKPTVEKTIEDLPGTQPDPEKDSSEATDVE